MNNRRGFDPRFPPVGLGDLKPPQDLSYIPSGPMRTTGKAALPFPGSVPSNLSAPPPGQSNFIYDPWHAATIISATVAPSVITNPDPQPFLVAPVTMRNTLMVRNASTGGQNVFLEFGKPCSVATVLLLAPNQILLFDTVVSQDDLYAACDVAGGILAFGYSTIASPL